MEQHEEKKLLRDVAVLRAAQQSWWKRELVAVAGRVLAALILYGLFLALRIGLLYFGYIK